MHLPAGKQVTLRFALDASPLAESLIILVLALHFCVLCVQIAIKIITFVTLVRLRHLEKQLKREYGSTPFR
jgi:hypothetical protein